MGKRSTLAGAVVLVVGLSLIVSGCSESEPPGEPGTAPAASDRAEGPPRVPSEVPTPDPHPDDFETRIDNPYLPYLPGTRWVYENSSSAGKERIVVTVTDRTRLVQGVRTTVVRDTVVDEQGNLVEDTYDWFAQDNAGNVWYFGEDTTAYEDGRPSKVGSWEAGVDGARAGVVMLADPRPGDRYQQEYYEGEAEDRAEVLSVDAAAEVPFGGFTNMVKTADTTPLEPEVLERKYYAEGVGFVYEEKVSGGDDRVRLVSMTKP